MGIIILARLSCQEINRENIFLTVFLSHVPNNNFLSYLLQRALILFSFGQHFYKVTLPFHSGKYSVERTALVLCFTKSFFPDDSQPVIVTIFADSVLQAPCPHALTALLPLMNQLPPLDDSCGSLCLWYCHVLLSIVFQVCLIFWIPVFQVLWISITQLEESVRARDY